MEREIQIMKKKTHIIFLSILLFFITIFVFYSKHDDIENEISNNPTEFPEDNPEIYPNDFIWSYRRSNGVLEYRNDYGSKYKILSNIGVTNSIIALYDPLFVTYIGKVDMENIDWKYKVSYDSHINYHEINACVIYLTNTSIIVNNHEYLIVGSNKISKNECILNMFETFDWFYKHEMFGEIKIKENN